MSQPPPSPTRSTALPGTRKSTPNMPMRGLSRPPQAPGRPTKPLPPGSARTLSRSGNVASTGNVHTLTDAQRMKAQELYARQRGSQTTSSPAVTRLASAGSLRSSGPVTPPRTLSPAVSPHIPAARQVSAPATPPHRPPTTRPLSGSGTLPRTLPSRNPIPSKTAPKVVRGEFMGEDESPSLSLSPTRDDAPPPLSPKPTAVPPPISPKPGSGEKSPRPGIPPRPPSTPRSEDDESESAHPPLPPKPAASPREEAPLPVPPKPALPPPPGGMAPPPKPALPVKPSYIPISKPQPPPKPAIPAKPTETPEVAPLEWPTDKTPFEGPDDPSVIVYDATDESQPFARPKIRAATIEKLVEKATSPQSLPSMQKTFLLTYRSIITPMELLDLLKLRYSMPLPEGNDASLKTFQATHQKPIQLRVCQLLKSWVQHHFTDFEKDEELRTAFMSFVVDTIKPSYPVGATLESIMTRQLNGEFAKAKEAIFSHPPPTPILPKGTHYTLLDVDALEIARQLTIIETQMFRAIAPHECIGLAWSKKGAKERAPNILAMINRFNQVSDWVVSEIVRTESAKTRSELLTHFVMIASRCKSLNNLNGAMEIISGLGNAAIFRLKANWADMSKKAAAVYEELKDILSSDSSYKSFRAHLKTCDGPCIPYLGMYLTDLTFIEDGNPVHISSLHNFFKCNLISSVIQEIQQYQQTPYHLEPVPAIQALVDTFTNNLSAEEAYQRSLQIQPRGGVKPSTSASSSTMLQAASPSSPRAGSAGTGTGQEDWGEMESVEGYLFDQPDDPTNLVLSEPPKDSYDPPVVEAGTLEKLVERLTFREYPDPGFMETFLLTYRAFASGRRLLELLIMRFHMPVPKNEAALTQYRVKVQAPVQLRVLNVFKIWTEKFPEDFLEDKALRDAFTSFCLENTSMHASKLKRMLKVLRRAMTTIRSGNSKAALSSPSDALLASEMKQPDPLPLREGADPKHLRLYDFAPEEVARQLMLEQFTILLNVRPLELLQYTTLQAASAPEKPSSESLARQVPTLKKLQRDGQNMTDWVLYEIFSKRTGDEEVDLSSYRDKLTFFIHVTERCLALKNFHAFAALFRAINDPIIAEFPGLWAALDGESRTYAIDLAKPFEFLTRLATLPKVYPANENTSVGLPPLEPFLAELEQLHAREKDAGDGTLINMAKFRRMASVVTQWESFKNTPPLYERVAFLTHYIAQDLPRLASHRSGISFVEQYESLDPDRIRQSLHSLLCEDTDVRQQLSHFLKGVLKDQLDEEAQLDELYQQLSDFKGSMRQEMQAIYDNLDQQDELAQRAKAYLRERFPQASEEDWSAEDQEGFVYGWPETVCVQTIQDSAAGRVVMFFTRSYLDKSELSLLLRLRSFYVQYSGSTEVQLLCVAGYIDSPIREVAQQNDVELVSLPSSTPWVDSS